MTSKPKHQKLAASFMLLVFFIGGSICLWFDDGERGAWLRARQGNRQGLAQIEKAIYRAGRKSSYFGLRLSAGGPVFLKSYDVQISREAYYRHKDDPLVQVMVDPAPNSYRVFLTDEPLSQTNRIGGWFLILLSVAGSLLGIWSTRRRS